MTNILTLESPQELLRIKREYILREIAVYGERERENLQQAMKAVNLIKLFSFYTRGK